MKTTLPCLALVLTLVLVSLGTAVAQTPPTPATPPPAPAFPAAVEAVLGQVALSGADRSDVHLTYLKTLCMPSVPGKVQAILVFEMSPAEMKPATPAPAPAVAPKPPADSATTPPATPAAPPAPLRVDVFLRLSRADAQGVYAPYNDFTVAYSEPADQAASAPAPYTVSLSVDPGLYKVLVAVSDESLQKFATARGGFELPVLAMGTGKLVTTPVFFAEAVNQQGGLVESSAHVRKDEFAFANLLIRPKLENVFNVGDSKEIIYCVFGGKPDMTAQPPKFNIEVTYTLKKGSESVIKFAKKNFDSPFIDHPLPLNPIDKTKQLEPGAYTLAIDIEDKLGSTKTSTTVPIEIK